MNAGPTKLRFKFECKVWFYNTPGTVYFVSLPSEMSEEILDLVGQSLNPWGTVPVDATIGEFTWASSMFPRKERKCYDLPLNAKVRKRVGLEAGSIISVRIEVPLPV